MPYAMNTEYPAVRSIDGHMTVENLLLIRKMSGCIQSEIGTYYIAGWKTREHHCHFENRQLHNTCSLERKEEDYQK